MTDAFDGGWATHSIDATDEFVLGIVHASHLATPSNHNGRSFNGIIPGGAFSPPSPGAAEGPAERVAEAAIPAPSVVPVGAHVGGDVGLIAGPLLVLPYPVMFPFSWKRKGFTEEGTGGGAGEGTQEGGGLMGANSLFEGQGFDWSMVYAMELYHSQSEGISRYVGRGELSEDNNFAAAVHLAVDDITDLFDRLDSNEYYSDTTITAVTRRQALYGPMG